MPVWHEFTRAWREAGELLVVGITQEQHPERCRLYAQWQEFDWPILWDPFNVTGSKAVPNVIAVDEHGVVRLVRPQTSSFERDFMSKEFEALPEVRPVVAEAASALVQVAAHPEGSFEGEHFRALSRLIWSRGDTDDAVELLEFQSAERPDEAALAFRAGVARRMRYDSEHRRPEDFQVAVDHWTRALALDPNQYIWRRRIQQYGPRMDKPYPFYTWVDQARTELAARGEEPVKLAAALTPAELAQPQQTPGGEAAAEEPDPGGEITRDAQGLISVESAVAFDTSNKTPTASVHLAFRPSSHRKAHWNNEAGPMQVWVGSNLADGWKLDAKLRAYEAPASEISAEVRHFTFEVELPAAAQEGELEAYALFYACEDVDGTCVYRRKDFTIPVLRPQ